ncbi:MAG: 4-(cytidine 5'-diphospho)-2-C-methyl-D-erythritol kinase, partial [candidate division WOR-3 bacterium]
MGQSSALHASRVKDRRVLRVRAPAKINLGLEVGRLRADGFHEVETLLARINLYDDLDLELTGQGIRLELIDSRLAGHDEVPGGPENLAIRAALLFRDYFGWPKGLLIALTKRIPLGAGLGGGSSDAAAVLKGLSKLYPGHLARLDLFRLAGELGSDVPFFLISGACRAQGRGEILTPVKLPKLHLLL